MNLSKGDTRSQLRLTQNEESMKLSEALALVQQRQETVPRRTLFLVCGFQPLHFATFLRGHFAQRFQEEAADIQTGLYGDLGPAFVAATESQAEAAIVVIEWSDLDPRLGSRSSGGWGPSVQDDMLANCLERSATFLQKLEEVASKMPVALALPTFCPFLFGHTTGWQMSAGEAELERQIAMFAASAAQLANVKLISASRLAQLSPAGDRFDANMEQAAGFPYTLAHASTLARQLIRVLYPASPMKGLITDLDDSLWSGIVGEVGAGAVSWSTAEHSQIHGLYQQQLRQLSEMGVLLGISSKNDITLVEEALSRPDLYVPRDAFFPVIANWSPKSEAVGAILRVWNIDASSVVYVDDSIMELEEVRAAFPSITCLHFPSGSPANVLELLQHLRDLFGKPTLHQDDALRQNSVRANVNFADAAEQSPPNEFIRRLEAKLTFDTRKDCSNQRLLELINKTNQFNLNGIRISEGEWIRLKTNPASFLVGVSYQDRYGPLGVIGVIAGMRNASHLEVSSWVLSCRAFSRKIEHHTLDYLFRSFGVETISLSFQPTTRNQPLWQFLNEIGLSTEGAGKLLLRREDFQSAQEKLPHMLLSQQPVATM